MKKPTILLVRATFYNHIRETLFAGSIQPLQLVGLENMLDYAGTNYPDMPLTALAYVLATVHHETGRTMQPIIESGGQKYLKSKPYYPFYGRGLVQLTWKINYQHFGINGDPNDALQWPLALKVLFLGMTTGAFTGKKLSDYFTSQRCDYIHAREIINGLDRAALIASYARSYHEALDAATS